MFLLHVYMLLSFSVLVKENFPHRDHVSYCIGSHDCHILFGVDGTFLKFLI